jgi:hypothetical protein
MRRLNATRVKGLPILVSDAPCADGRREKKIVGRVPAVINGTPSTREVFVQLAFTSGQLRSATRVCAGPRIRNGTRRNSYGVVAPVVLLETPRRVTR